MALHKRVWLALCPCLPSMLLVDQVIQLIEHSTKFRNEKGVEISVGVENALLTCLTADDMEKFLDA